MVPLRTNLEHDTTSLLCGSSAVQTADVQGRLGDLNPPHMAHAHSGPGSHVEPIGLFGERLPPSSTSTHHIK